MQLEPDNSSCNFSLLILCTVYKATRDSPYALIQKLWLEDALIMGILEQCYYSIFNVKCIPADANKLRATHNQICFFFDFVNSPFCPFWFHCASLSKMGLFNAWLIHAWLLALKTLPSYGGPWKPPRWIEICSSNYYESGNNGCLSNVYFFLTVSCPFWFYCASLSKVGLFNIEIYACMVTGFTERCCYHMEPLQMITDQLWSLLEEWIQ